MNGHEQEPALLEKYPLQTLYFYLTGDCNLACRHCWISPDYQRTAVSHSGLDYDLFKSIIAEAEPLGLTSVKLTGGEPLIHPRIGDILSFIQGEDLGLTIESNGIALTPALALQISESKNPFLSISLDGSDAATHEWVRGVPGSFDLAVNGIRTAVDAGIRPQVIMTIMRRNVHQTESLIELARDLGAGSVKINVLQPTARGKSLHEQGENLTIGELVTLGSWIEQDIADTASLPVIFGHPHAFRPLGRMFQGNCSCGTCNIHHILGVLHDGSYALCGVGATVPEMVFGHAGRDRLSEVWCRNRVVQQIREGIPASLKGICHDCALKHLCLGSCVAQNFVSTGDLFAPFWYCHEAAREGVFPSSRLLPIK